MLLLAGCGRVGFDAAEPPGVDAAAPDAGSACAAGFAPLAGAPARYLFDLTARTWAQARDACAARGAGYHLVILVDDAERAALAAAARAAVDSTWWLGATDEATEGTWINVDATPTTYLPWANGEPNDAGGEDCLGLLAVSGETADRAAFANDEACGDPFPSICACDR